MKNTTPAGFTKTQWAAITEDLHEHPETMNDYRKVINRLMNQNPEIENFANITKREAALFFDTLDQQVKDGSLSANTAHRYKATLRSVAAHMQQHPNIYPSYENPFKGMLGVEERHKTVYADMTFSRPENLKKILSVLNEFTPEEQSALRLMLFAGLSPAQIQSLKVNSFHINEKDELELMADLGLLIEHTDLPWRQSELYKAGIPVHYVSRSKSHTITWRYTGTFCLSRSMQDLLKSYYPYTGSSKDDRFYFLTQRHQKYSYRSIHRLVTEVCQKAGLEAGTVTPHQLSLHGMLYSWEAFQKGQSRHTGIWKDRYPDPMQIQMDEILKQFSKDKIHEMIITEE